MSHYSHTRSTGPRSRPASFPTRNNAFFRGITRGATFRLFKTLDGTTFTNIVMRLPRMTGDNITNLLLRFGYMYIDATAPYSSRVA